MIYVQIAIIAVAYSALWYLTIKCNRIINKISEKKLQTSRDISNNLKL